MATIQAQLKAFNDAFSKKHTFKPPEFYSNVEEFADIYLRDVEHLHNPIREEWWYNVMKDDILATCDKSLSNFFIPRLLNLGTPEALRIYELGKSYENGNGVEKNLELAYSHYMTAAEMGNADAQVIIGFALMSGRFGIVDEKKGHEWFLEAARSGNPNGAYFAGLCYSRGTGVEKNEKEAEECLQYAAKAGHEDAKYILSFEEAPAPAPADSQDDSETEDERSIFSALQQSRRLLRKSKKMVESDPSKENLAMLKSAISLHKEMISAMDVSVDARIAVLDTQLEHVSE